jgi:DNA-binding XRE family transcriptional regulator
MITSIQSKAARAMLDWTQDDLATASGVNKKTVVAIEQGNVNARRETIQTLQNTFEKHGIEFLPGNGVRPRDEIVTVFEGDEAEELLLNDIYETMRVTGGGEILIYGLAEMDPKKEKEAYELSKAQIQRLMRANITERILGKEGDTNFVAPTNWYRWLPAKGFASVPLFIYGDKIALSTDSKPLKAIIIQNRLFSDTCRHLFNFSWDRAVIPTLPKE